MPSRVKSSTLHVPCRSSNSSRIGPSSERESVIASPASGWNENVMDASHRDLAQECLRARHARHRERRSRPDPVGLDRARDRAGELAVLDAQPMHPPLEAVAAHERGQRPRVGARVARVRADERGGDRACARRLRRVVGRHLIRCGRGGRSGRRRAARDRDDQDEQQRGGRSAAHGRAESTRLFGRSGGRAAAVCSRRRSRPGGRGRSSDRSRKVRTPKGRVLGRPRRGRPRGSATEKRPPSRDPSRAVRVKR